MRRALVLLIALSAGAAAAQPLDRLALLGRVSDYAEILSPVTEAALTERLEAHEDSTSNQVVVVTLTSLNGAAIEPVANVLFNAWGLGQAARNNGVLLLIARDDRELRIEVGLGLEGDLTDAEAGRIIRHVIVPAFRSGDFDGGTLAGATAILGTLDGTYTPPAGTDGEEGAPWWLGLVFLVTHVFLPGVMALRALVMPPVSRYSTFIFTLFFIGPMLLILGVLLFFGAPSDGSGFAATWLGVALFVLYVLAWIAADIYMAVAPKWQAIRKEVREAVEKGKKTKVDAGWISFSAGGSSGGSGGGGGFSGGGGSSGGGGASGSW